MICGSCHSEMPEDSKYCTVCGMLIMSRGVDRENIPEPVAEPTVSKLGDAEAGPYRPRVYVDTYTPPAQFVPYALQREPEQYKPPSEAPEYPKPYAWQRERGAEACESCPPGLAPTEQMAHSAETDSERGLGNITVTSSGMEPRMTAGQFFLMELLALVPVVGFVVMCVWAFSGRVNANRSALAQAKLIITLVAATVTLLVFIVLLYLVANDLITLRWLTFG